MNIVFFFFFFFFSSRRRHTRSLRDWSSDVCSSDLRETVARFGDESRLSADDLVVAVEQAIRVADEVRPASGRSEEHTSELQSRRDLVCRLLLEKKKKKRIKTKISTYKITI